MNKYMILYPFFCAILFSFTLSPAWMLLYCKFIGFTAVLFAPLIYCVLRDRNDIH